MNAEDCLKKADEIINELKENRINDKMKTIKGIVDNLNNERVATLKELEEGCNKKDVREILNKWFKQQRKITDPDGKFRGYLITKSQVEKIKELLWRLRC